MPYASVDNCKYCREFFDGYPIKKKYAELFNDKGCRTPKKEYLIRGLGAWNTKIPIVFEFNREINRAKEDFEYENRKRVINFEHPDGDVSVCRDCLLKYAEELSE